MSDYAADPVVDMLVYDYREASRLLRVPASTLWWWLEGRPVKYEPVLRESATGSRDVTWGEFVEAGLLRKYRKDHGVSLQQLRGFIKALRSTLGVRYPLAHAEPWVGDGRRLLLNAQYQSQLPAELWTVFEPSTGQILLTPPGESFLQDVEFEQPNRGPVTRIHPRGRTSPVTIDPGVRFGSPSVGGISTGALAELVLAGDHLEEVAGAYRLQIADVVAALDWELELAAAA